MRPIVSLVPLVILLAFSACGGDGNSTASTAVDTAGESSSAKPSEQLSPDEAAVRSCLEEGGADIVTSDPANPNTTNTLDVLAIGPGGGRIQLVFAPDADIADSIANGYTLGTKPLSVSTVNDGKTVIGIEPDPNPDDEALASECAEAI